MQRNCDLCGMPYEAKRATSRFCKPAHRKAWAVGSRPPAEMPPTTPAEREKRPTPITDSLATEFETLGVATRYEAATALGLAKQLDSGTITGSAYVSLSKELDRRVDALRLKGKLPHDPVEKILGQVDDKQQHLRLA